MDLHKVKADFGRFSVGQSIPSLYALIPPELLIFQVKILKTFLMEIIMLTFVSHSTSSSAKL